MLEPKRRWIGPFCKPGRDSANAPLLDRFLSARGHEGSDAHSFRNPSLTHLHDPEAIPGLEQASVRILDALKRRESIVIYGDYDVDGVTATAILLRTLRAIDRDARLQHFIPHRLSDGYGVNESAIRSLASAGVTLIITVDCGVTARQEAAVARALNVDLIITDHHTPPSAPTDLPDALAVVHPRLPGASHDHPDLTGAGVAYKLAWRLATLASDADRATPALRALLVDLLSLAALGTIADVANLTEDNRVIARFGLRRMRGSPFIGLRALIDASRLSGEDIDEERVGFILAPRLNAIGRLGHAREALELLMTDDERRAKEISKRLCSVNEERRNVERTIFDAASAMAQERNMTGAGDRAIVLAHEDWHPGVVGIVCSRLVEQHGRPAILLCKDGDTWRGSGRSVPALDLHGALEACATHLATYGGHAMAAGLSLQNEQLDAFVTTFTDVVNTSLSPGDLQHELHIDCEASADELTRSVVAQLLDLGPFGQGNPTPVLLLRDVRLATPPKVMGQHGAHLALTIGDRAQGSMRLVGWRQGDLAAQMRAGLHLDIAMTPKFNTWQGRTSVEGDIRDMRTARKSLANCQPITASSPN